MMGIQSLSCFDNWQRNLRSPRVLPNNEIHEASENELSGQRPALFCKRWIKICQAAETPSFTG